MLCCIIYWRNGRNGRSILLVVIWCTGLRGRTNAAVPRGLTIKPLIIISIPSPRRHRVAFSLLPGREPGSLLHEAGLETESVK